MATGDVKRKLTAIFSADVEGYSRLMGEDELATIETLTSHKETMGKLIRQYRGRVVDSTGDNLLAEFGSVVDAVQCAVEVQQVLSSKNETLPENRRMHFRIGINSGDVVEEDERIYGDGVNVAARVESLAKGGGISISGTAYDQLGKKLPLGYEYLGEQAVKNIEKPVRVYRVLTEAEAAGKVIGEEKPKTRQLRWAAIGGVVVLILVAGALAIWNFYLRPPFERASEERMAFALPDKPSIAVLPFVNMSEDPKQEYFSDGLAEEIITALSKVPKVFVIARNSTFSYKGKSVKVNQVAEELGVRYVLEGSVRKAGDRVRITAQLVDALAGHHLWAERYEKDLKDIFALQDEITMKIITALQVKLTDGEIASISAKGTQNLEAYLKVLQAREPFYTITKEGFAQARRLCEEAIALDPDYAGAYAYLGSTHFMDAIMGSSKSPAESLKLAFKSIKKAIALDDSFAEAHSLLGFLYVLTKKYDEGIAECEHAIAVEPNSAGANIWMSLVLTHAGSHEEAVRYAERALRLDPFPVGWWFRALGQAYSWVDRYEEAITAYKEALQRAPNDIRTHLPLTVVYSWAGRSEEARAQGSEVLRINPKYSLEVARKKSLYKKQADRDRYLDALRKAGIPETPPLPLPDKPSIAVLPFVNMSGDPEQEYFSDGITEEIITALSKLRDILVIARTSSFRYKGKDVDVRTIGRELGVRYVLEGSVRKAREKVRITAQLINAETNQHLWAERYDRELKDLFAIQDEITMKIITALSVRLSEGELARILAKRAKNLDVFLKQLETRSLWAKGTPKAQMRFRQVAQEVIDMAPESGVGYRLLAWYYWSLAYSGGKSPRENIAKAFRLAQKALSLDESDAITHALLGSIYLLMRQYEKAIAAGERSVELHPNAAMPHGLLGNTLSYAGRVDEAITHIKQGIRLNPFPEFWYFHNLGRCYWQKGEYEKALAEFKKALQLAPGNWGAQTGITAMYSLLGQEDKALAAAKKVLEMNPNFSVDSLSKSMPYKNKADLEALLDALLKAGLK